MQSPMIQRHSIFHAPSQSCTTNYQRANQKSAQTLDLCFLIHTKLHLCFPLVFPFVFPFPTNNLIASKQMPRWPPSAEFSAAAVPQPGSWLNAANLGFGVQVLQRHLGFRVKGVERNSGAVKRM